MRALFLVHNLPDRGSYFRALEIARRFALRGHQAQFAFTSNEKKYRPRYTPASAEQAYIKPPVTDSTSRRMIVKEALSNDQNFVWAEMPHFTLFNDRQEGWSLPDWVFRGKDALSGEWDLVYGFSHKPNCLFPGILARTRGAKLVLDWSDWWTGPNGLFQQCVISSNAFQSMPGPLRLGRRLAFSAEGFIEPRAYGIADAVTLTSEDFYNFPGAPVDLRNKSYVMHSGAPLDRVVPLEKTEARRHISWRGPDDATVLGYIANFHMDERLLMEAFASVCEVRPDVYLLVVGADLEASTPEIHRHTAGRIHHFGRQPFETIGSFLGSADILLLPLTDIPLDRARYPHKISDYVAAGRPIIACDVGETGRLFRKFGIGRLAEPTAESFSDAIVQVCADRDTWGDLGRQARQSAELHFNWDSMCDGLFDFLADRLKVTI